MLKICLIVGSQKSNFCGVKNYTEQLAAALNSLGMSASVLAPAGWGFIAFKALLCRLTELQPDVLHVQYPSLGYRASLLPQLLGRTRAAPITVATIHEFSALPKSQQLAVHLFRLTAHARVFVSQYEKDCFQRHLRCTGINRVIPIGSNIPVSPEPAERCPVVVYFGQVRPSKGIERFLELAKLSTSQHLPFRFEVIGSAPEKFREYGNRLRSESSHYAEWKIGLNSSGVSRRLASSLAAYLPFPDGASERRGSLLASLSNGLPVISTVGPATGALSGHFLVAHSPAEALPHLLELMRNPHWSHALRARERVFARQFDWAAIAASHRDLYSAVLQTSAHLDGAASPSSSAQVASQQFLPTAPASATTRQPGSPNHF